MNIESFMSEFPFITKVVLSTCVSPGYNGSGNRENGFISTSIKGRRLLGTCAGSNCSRKSSVGKEEIKISKMWYFKNSVFFLSRAFVHTSLLCFTLSLS